ncbi:hypothetical protein DPMN_003435 [Dreissena polymorpha]|uniref:Uncharacterized protein n=1 Tax=Dreissena polymorpha TaxID=45954 RepID=A0A9D4MKY4_DREPO|nr:hypothetical protein DPMN_003435 [Dreissena polymorpha]
MSQHNNSKGYMRGQPSQQCHTHDDDVLQLTPVLTLVSGKGSRHQSTKLNRPFRKTSCCIS